MMISPKLHAIWPVFFLNLSQNLIVILLMYLGTWATASYCRAGIKSLRGTLPHGTAGVAEPSHVLSAS
jgi:hypothetical protein